MKTDELIRTLTADGPSPQPALDKLLVAAGLIGFALAAMLFMMTLYPRQDIAVVAHEFNFQLKFVVTLALAVTAAGLFWRMLHPGARLGLWAPALVVAPLLLLGAVSHEMMVLPSGAWPRSMVGQNSVVCLLSIPFLAAPILAGLLYISRHGAPERPMLTGALAGLVAGGLGAALYATHCTDDSPLFVLAWYSVAIAAVAALGAILGERLLRW